MTDSRKYWVVSPNVGKPGCAGKWQQSSRDWRAAFMGYRPDDQKHPLGRRFAEDIDPNDIILIGRRHHGKHELVGIGRVVGAYETRISGFNPVGEFGDKFGSLRRLDPFVDLQEVPDDITFADALKPIAAMHQLHPESKPGHKVLCDWMDKKLAIAKPEDRLDNVLGRSSRVELTSLPKEHHFAYQYKSLASIRKARKLEAALVGRYEQWITARGRSLKIFQTHSIKCDAYEEARQNLIEAKCSVKREYIRMAVGQLLDYAFHSKSHLGDCHMAILLPSKPKGRLLTWLGSIGIFVIWEERSTFLDNAHNQFT